MAAASVMTRGIAGYMNPRCQGPQSTGAPRQMPAVFVRAPVCMPDRYGVFTSVVGQIVRGLITYFLAITPISADTPLWPVPSWISAS